MITFVEGVVEVRQPTRIVINAGGVGYEVFIPLSSYDHIPQVGKSFRILTHHNIREDAEDLFGFATEAEREMFTRLLMVSGIGPKLAMSALSGMSVRELVASIASGDVKRLSTISGVGKKTAERMVVELRDRLAKSEILGALGSGQGAGGLPVDGRLRDAILALVALQFNQADAEKMVQRIASGVTEKEGVQDIVRKALAG